MFAGLSISNKTENYLLVLFGKKTYAAEKQCFSKGSDYNQHSNKAKLNNKETFLVKGLYWLQIYINYNVYKESYQQKTMNTFFFSASSKTFLKYCYELFFNVTLTSQKQSSRGVL